MTNYGTIPTSSAPGSSSINQDYISRTKERIVAGLGTRRPWKLMFDYHKFNFPSSFSEAVNRLKTSIPYFLMNYALIVLGILLVSLLWHPISLIVFLIMMAAWVTLYFMRDVPLVIFNRTISDLVVLIVLTILTVVLLLFTGATLNILISLLVGLVVVALHAALRKTEDLYVDEESAGLLHSGVSDSS